MELYGRSSGLKQHFFVKEERTWDSANDCCKTYFYDLSTFTNESEEQQFLEDVLSQTSDAWVGLYIMEVVRRIRKKLHDKECTAEYAAFCMTNFVLVDQKETWDGALEYCRTHYNDLASLSTKERMDSALLEITRTETEYARTGLRFLAGDWIWVNGDDLDNIAWYQNEQPQCPARDLRCGALDKQKNLWTHRNCEEKLSFFCQYGAMKQTNS